VFGDVGEIVRLESMLLMIWGGYSSSTLTLHSVLLPPFTWRHRGAQGLHRQANLDQANVTNLLLESLRMDLVAFEFAPFAFGRR